MAAVLSLGFLRLAFFNKLGSVKRVAADVYVRSVATWVV